MRDLQYCDKCDHYYKTHCKCASKPETKPTPADDPSGQTLAGAGGDGVKPADVERALSIFYGKPWPNGYVRDVQEKARSNMYRVLRHLTATSAGTTGDDSEDAARWQYLRDVPCNHFQLTRNDEHAPNYMTAAAWIEEYPEDFTETPSEELERMKATNTIWCFQIYPDTPIGFYRFYGATAEAAIDTARRAREVGNG